jgi:hypothetical protein
MRPGNFNRRLRGTFEDITGRAWLFIALIVVVVVVMGPVAIHVVQGALGSSVNTVSSRFQILN